MSWLVDLFKKKIGGRYVCEKCKKEMQTAEIFCEECQTLYFYINSIRERPYKKEAHYIFYLGVEDNGIGWYEKARDKLMRKIAEDKEAERLRIAKDNKKIVKKINEW